MASLCQASTTKGSLKGPYVPNLSHLAASIPPKLKPFLKELQQLPMRTDIAKAAKNTSQRLLDAFVDSTFRFVDQPRLPSQRNFAPVDEIGDPAFITCIEGEIPDDFPEGIYIRNGPNPMFGALHDTESVFGRSSNIWVEGEGMLHALYFTKKGNTINGGASANSSWSLSYKNRYVETETLQMEKERRRPQFIPSVEGNPMAILAAFLFNQLRFGKVNKDLSNTAVFEHSGRHFTVAESNIPYEFDPISLETGSSWNVDATWSRSFTAHPKRDPETGELVITRVDGAKPFFVLGVISADGSKLKHKVDLKVKRTTFCHDLGITKMYNVVMDMPLTIDVGRVMKGGPLIKYDRESYTRIGVMPRYGDEYSIKWFEVEPCCTFHFVNCFEDGDEVVVRGCKALESIIPGPEWRHDKLDWFSRGFKKNGAKNPIEEQGFLEMRLYEWRLNMKCGDVTERYLTDANFSVDFPFINDRFISLHNKYGYGQVVDSEASSISALAKYGGLVKFYLTETANTISQLQEQTCEEIKTEYHHLGGNQFCSGAVFVARNDDSEEEEEDDGWIVSFVHSEDTDISQVHIIDAKNFKSKPVAKITLPQRVPYGFHGTFIRRTKPTPK